MHKRPDFKKKRQISAVARMREVIENIDRDLANSAMHHAVEWIQEARRRLEQRRERHLAVLKNTERKISMRGSKA